jgi:hypothetical protein
MVSKKKNIVYRPTIQHNSKIIWFLKYRLTLSDTTKFLEQSNPVRGMKDRFGEENRRFQWINDKGAKIAGLYGFDQVSTKQQKMPRSSSQLQPQIPRITVSQETLAHNLTNR